MNLAAYGCKACRMHGAHKSRNVLRGEKHPQFKKGEETKEARLKRSERSALLLYLRDLGDSANLFKGAKTPGRKPKSYIKVTDKEDGSVALPIIRILLTRNSW